jgi:heme/copper-type cytochrome/quinol oxidase subunit 3
MDAIHTAAPRPVERPRVQAVGATLIAAMAAMFFAAMLGAYLFLRSATLADGGDWLADITIPLQPANVMMATLVASCVTMQWAFYAVARNDRVNAYVALGITVLFGAATINAQYWMYQQMNIGISDSVEAVLIYAITGAYIALLISAMAYVATTTFRTLGGQYGPHQHDGVAGAAIYWYVTVAIFAAIWITIYITK